MRFVANTAGKAHVDAAALLPDAHLAVSMRTLRGRFPELVAPRLVPFPRAPQVFLLDETAQVTGSFKVRGGLAKLEALKAAGVSQVIAASAGNHGAGVAFAAARIGLRATVVVPKGAPEVKKAKIAAALGVTLHVSHADDYDGAEAEAQAMAARASVPFVSPYDDAFVLAGNGMSLGYDLADLLRGQFGGLLPSPLHVLAPVGGGGLAVGLACALPEAKVYGVQSEASAALALSFERGAAVVTLPQASATWAEGLEGGIAENAYFRARQVLSGVFVASETEIQEALVYAHRELEIPVEGSSAVALTPILSGAVVGQNGVVVCVLTGRNIDAIKLKGL